ncbi:GNAT family N-acetyltransferase [Sphingomonas sp. 28-63-12]|uniref:GNAT family N-acetyltransferase n=1 Tax=Sphingomonas sp. 28-63-12 TaxID=1970434 RepID=UPI000BDD8272|nr:MAG: GNAT family N-acetyltransferase [Sphingomonas sp. 28-63-12]
MAIAIRPATQHDLPALHALIESAYRGKHARGGWTHEADLLDGQRTDIAALAESLANPSHCVLVAIHAAVAGAVAGCVEITDKTGGLAYLGLLSVAPEGQAQGLGKYLIAEAEAEAIRRFGTTRMELTVIRQRAELVAFYERRGYRLTGEERPFPYGDTRFGEPRRDDLVFVVLARDLAKA